MMRRPPARELPDNILYPVTSLARQLEETYGSHLPESLDTELNRYLVALYDADHDRWADSPTLYRRTAAKIEARILAGEWADREPLPTRALAREYKVSEDSLRKAYRKLWEHELARPLGPQRRWCVVREDSPFECRPARTAGTRPTARAMSPRDPRP